MRRCGECGAVLKDRPASLQGEEKCPLCGTALKVREKAPPEAPDDYQAEVRSLREELQRLRNGGEVA